MKTTEIGKARILTATILGLGVALLVSACSGEPEQDATGAGDTKTRIERLSDGTAVVHTDRPAESSGAESAVSENPASEASDKKNCVYIQYCRAPGSGRIICRTYGCGCTYREAQDECFRDARAVCGNTYYMTSYICHSDQP